MTQLCGPSPSYSCDTAGYAGQSTSWWGRYYGKGYASSNSYGYHNCTLYAAYRIAQNGAVNPGWSANAKDWATAAFKHGTPVNQTPAVGAIAQWNRDHVAYVEVVTATYIEISDDNYGLNTTDRFRIAVGSPAWPDNFIHFKDVTGGLQAPKLSLYSANQTGAGDQTNDVALAWTPATGGSGSISRYSVFRNGVLIATMPGSVLAYTDTHLPDGGMLNYQVTATDSLGDVSQLSDTISVPYLPPDQSGLAWLGSSGTTKVRYCRRGGMGGSFSTQYLICTTFNGSSWTTRTSRTGVDWGYPTGRGWVTTSTGVAYCRRGGMGGSFSTQYLICTTFNGRTWTTRNSPVGVDWGYDVGWAWLSTRLGIAYCRRGGMGGSFSTQYLICTTFNGRTWTTRNSPAGVDWGYDPGADWVTLNGYPAYCRTTGVAPRKYQALYCTVFNGKTWRTYNSGGGIDWGYPTGRGWVTTSTGVAYCRRGGMGGSFSTQYLICTTFNGRTWTTRNSPAGVDWGYDT